MKGQKILFVVLLFLCNSLFSQNNSDSLNIKKIEFLHSFYSEYFIAASQDLPDFSKIDSLQSHYCTTELYNELLYLYNTEEIEADPFLESQDPQKESLKSLRINVDDQDNSLFIITYKVNEQETNLIKLRVIEVAKNNFKISSIISIEN
ncbi:MAG TPA: hypothetical protein PLH70_05915 [Bacteroidales bacterium]|nr:hypothetical protein [Bacteroidales bacterium]HOH22645.1 hypothetical protein [Bacteroidales bacterium]HPB57766.1 hypothetical protein [Bacteroidales bacterium]HPZ03790.1 hypothetical protein [Bacteroidales bacterium]HQB75318.1 hypothetical protein [Bacteroidales bacterium]